MRNEVQKHVATLQDRALALEEQYVGAMPFTNALSVATQVRKNNITVEQAMYGANAVNAFRESPDDVMDLLLELFAEAFEMMNVNHPWHTEDRAVRQIEEMLAFDPTWTLEDFCIFFDMLSQDDFKEKHYGRPSRGWLKECQIDYNGLKVDAREEIVRKRKLKAQADAAERAYYITAGMELPTSEGRMEKARTMAEFLGGLNRLSAADRAEMKERDEKRRNGAAE